MAAISGQVTNGQIICVEAFPKSRIDEINASLSAFIGEETKPGNPQTEAEEQRSRWEPGNLDVFFEEVLARSNGEKYGGSLESFRAFIESVDVESLNTSSLPFYLVVLKAKLNPKVIDASEDLEKDLRSIYNPLRVSMESLEGMTSECRPMGPRIPMAIYLNVKVSPEDLSRLQQAEMKLERSFEEDPEGWATQSGKLREMEPFNLSQLPGGDLHSHLIAFSNVSIIFGHAYQLGLYGLSTPYVIVLSTGGGLDQDQFHFPLLPFPPAEIRDISWRGPSVLAVPLALLIWLDWFWSEFSRLEGSVIQSRPETSEIHTQDLATSLKRLTPLGLEAASFEVDIGVLKRRLAPAFEKWTDTGYPGAREIPVFPTGSFGSQLMASWQTGGYMAALSGEILDHLSRSEAAVQNLGKRIDILSRHASDAVSRNSIQAMHEATEATKRSTRSVLYLTGALVALTAVLVALAVMGFLP